MDRRATQPDVRTLPNSSRIGLSPVKFAELTGLKRAAVYRAIQDGTINAVLFGNLYRIPASEVARLFGTDVPSPHTPSPQGRNS
ncbi:helix-turn-helix domain-containing protein [Saccharothrix variisporea]|uniref:helix-turn-helix domain-containing protein n=1 Tax=Saccharothrix variisporea TaxID=543527 RepID=UPI0037C5D2F7